MDSDPWNPPAWLRHQPVHLATDPEVQEFLLSALRDFNTAVAPQTIIDLAFEEFGDDGYRVLDMAYVVH